MNESIHYLNLNDLITQMIKFELLINMQFTIRLTFVKESIVQMRLEVLYHKKKCFNKNVRNLIEQKRTERNAT